MYANRIGADEIPVEWLDSVADGGGAIEVVVYAREFVNTTTDNTKTDIPQSRGLLDVLASSSGVKNKLYISLWVNVYWWGDVGDYRIDDHVGPRTYGDYGYDDALTGDRIHLTQLPELIQVTIPLAGTEVDGASASELKVFRVHEGIATELPLHPNANASGEYYALVNNCVVLHVKYFSEFSIATTSPTQPPPPPNDDPQSDPAPGPTPGTEPNLEPGFTPETETELELGPDLPPKSETELEQAVSPKIVFPEGVTADDFPQIDFNALQPDPSKPGGTVREAPPVPSDIDNTLMPQIGEDGAVFFIEFDGDAPIGVWNWDVVKEIWMFTDLSPLGVLPKTGDEGVLLLPLIVFGACTLFSLCIILRLKLPKKKKEK